MRKNPCKVIFLSFISLLMVGCWDYKDINDRSITLSIGIDYEDEGKVQFTGEVAELSPDSMKGQENVQLSATYEFISKGKDFEEARNDFDRKVTGQDFTGAALVVAFSEKYAEGGIEPYINRITKLYGYRSALLIVISREPPKELYKSKIHGSIGVGFAIEETIRHFSEEGGTLYITANEVHSDMNVREMGYLLPYIGVEDNSIKYLGFAVMKNSKLIGLIDAKDTVGANFLIAKNASVIQSLINPKNKENKLSVQTKLSKRKIKTKYEDGIVQINIDIDVGSQIQYTYYHQLITNEEIKIFESIISEKLKEDILNIVEKSQKEYKSDFFKFIKYFKAQNPEVYKNIKWEDEYPKAKINVNVNAKIINTNVLRVE